jgi:peptidoglycan/xylan/chitin deacetylase (PgdA/CDA1 family)
MRRQLNSFAREGAIILMYHSVAADAEARFIERGNRIAPEVFERQMAFLRRKRRVVALSELVDDVARGRTPPRGTVCITFDDGYRDNLTIAAPILDRHRLPATLFLATGLVERGENQWSDTLRSLPAKEKERLIQAGHAARMARLARSRPEAAPRLTMRWDEARELVRRYPLFEIGGHTRDHVDLSRHRGEAARAQIAGCAEDLRRELGLRPRHFSFPYARWCAETRDLVIAAGWSSAVGMAEGLRIGAGSDRFAMPRLQAPRGLMRLRWQLS